MHRGSDGRRRRRAPPVLSERGLRGLASTRSYQPSTGALRGCGEVSPASSAERGLGWPVAPAGSPSVAPAFRRPLPTWAPAPLRRSRPRPPLSTAARPRWPCSRLDSVPLGFEGGPLRRASRLSGPVSLPPRGAGRPFSKSCVGPGLAPSATAPLGPCLGYPAVRCIPPSRQGFRSQLFGCSALRSLQPLHNSARVGPPPLWPRCEELGSRGSRLAVPSSLGQRSSTLHSFCRRWRGAAFLRAAVSPSQSARLPLPSPVSRQPTVPLHELGRPSLDRLDVPSFHHARWVTGSVGQRRTGARGTGRKVRLPGFETPTFGFQVSCATR